MQIIRSSLVGQLSWIILWYILLKGKQMLSVGELIRVNYTYIFTLLYLVFVSCLSSFCKLLHVTYLIGDTWVKELKRRRKRTKGAKNRESWDSCCDMVFSCCGMPMYHTNSREQYAATWSFCVAACYVGQIEDYRRHVTACQNYVAAWQPWLVNFIFE